MGIHKELYDIISESIDILHALDESEASARAKELGLVSRGFGRYSKTEDGPITHKTVNGKLVIAIHKPIQQKVKKKEIPVDTMSHVAVDPSASIIRTSKPFKKIGVTDIQRAAGRKPLFTFRYNGRAGRITLTDKEEEALISGILSISKIIMLRIKQKELNKKKILPKSIEKQLKQRSAKLKSFIPKQKQQ